MAAHDDASESDEAAMAGPSPSDEGVSIVEQLRARRAERLADEHLDLPIPTWEGQLVARYRVVRGEEVRKLLQRASTGRADQTADASFLVTACEQVFAMDDEGRMVVLRRPDGMPMRYEPALGELVAGERFERAVALVYHLFADNDLAISSHALKLAQWMQDTSREVEGAIVGEAPTGRSSS